ncbi:biotin/lipoyl-containing protein [Plebeiibacterium sediminum]|uniref:Biotin/lipoyl-binding protein n=1 Tax=Plebeiibacterium sediminum TaxID=2992112 RepID=A0AAE3M3X6_9BACT|nr:biotin/lipoyl-containing protein [Plebeiobacterium sediminum]MCW3786357.1 biotin/lipoyl-binding protein [Plebeiobacterium sediminum]
MSDKEELVGFRVHTMEYQTKVTKKYANRKAWQAPDPNEIKSYIPGTIIKINVKVGDKVKEGESLLVLEAMKMQNQIAMPFDGTVKEICVKEGDKIPKNELMVVIEE